LEKRAEQVLPGSEEFGGEGRAGGRDGSNSICTFE
jgi:hypothetical protein